MGELIVDFITSLDGYASAEGWPGWWPRRPRVPRLARRATPGHSAHGCGYVPADVGSRHAVPRQLL